MDLGTVLVPHLPTVPALCPGSGTPRLGVARDHRGRHAGQVGPHLGRRHHLHVVPEAQQRPRRRHRREPQPQDGPRIIPRAPIPIGRSSTCCRSASHTSASSTPSRRRTGASSATADATRDTRNSRGSPPWSATRYQIPALLTSPYGPTTDRKSTRLNSSHLGI